jgi:hypothetical protein
LIVPEAASDRRGAVLRSLRVAAFSGHMVDAPGRPSPRFPHSKVGAVRRAIAELLRQYGIGYGFSSAARGSDILFLEELKKRGGSGQVFLPFPRKQFKRTSVGYGWDDRFDKALEGFDVVELSAEMPPEEKRPEAYAACNSKILETAIKKAKLLNEDPIFIVVWNGAPAAGAGGTADAVRAWGDQGFAVEQIDVSQL